MRFFFISILLIYTTLSFCQEITVKTFYPNNKLKESYGAVVRGNDTIKNGTFTYFYENGVIMQQGQIIEDQLQGEWFTYFPDGRLKSKFLIVDGLKHGNYVLYYENGIVREKGRMIGDKPSGTIRSYHENGNIATIIDFKNGKQDGIKKTYNSAGLLLSEIEYADGKVDGVYHTYYDNQKIN
mgnify:CR=1 FL=1